MMVSCRLGREGHQEKEPRGTGANWPRAGMLWEAWGQCGGQRACWDERDVLMPRTWSLGVH